jgi:hypothetical protein
MSAYPLVQVEADGRNLVYPIPRVVAAHVGAMAVEQDLLAFDPVAAGMRCCCVATFAFACAIQSAVPSVAIRRA